MILPKGLIRGGFYIFDIDTRLGLSCYLSGRSRDHVQREMFPNNMKKEITLSKSEHNIRFQRIETADSFRPFRGRFQVLCLYQVHRIRFQPLKRA